MRAKTAEPNGTPFRLWAQMGPTNHCYMGSRYAIGCGNFWRKGRPHSTSLFFYSKHCLRCVLTDDLEAFTVFSFNDSRRFAVPYNSTTGIAQPASSHSCGDSAVKTAICPLIRQWHRNVCQSYSPPLVTLLIKVCLSGATMTRKAISGSCLLLGAMMSQRWVLGLLALTRTPII